MELGWDLIEQSCSETKQLGRNQQQNGTIVVSNRQPMRVVSGTQRNIARALDTVVPRSNLLEEDFGGIGPCSA